MPHFGLEGAAPYLLYYMGVLAFFLSILWRPIFGLLYFCPLIPIQTVRYWMHPFPGGQSVQDLMLLGIALGLLRRKEEIFADSPLTKLLGAFAAYTYISLWLGALFLGTDLPFFFDNPRLIDWKNFMALPMLYFLVRGAVTERWHFYAVIGLMVLSTLMLNRSFHDSVVGKDMTEYKEENRAEGAMGYAGVNGMAAYEASFSCVLLALAFFERNWLIKSVYLSTAGFSIYCLLFAFSRGGYLAILLGLIFLGVVKSRVILVMMVLFLISWETLVPPAVHQRVSGTYNANGDLENSSAIRVNLWDEAMAVFKTNPVTGMGVFTYAYMGGRFKNPHNYYVQALVEGGVIGLGFFLMILWGMFRMGYRLFRQGTDPLFQSIGLGLCCWIVCAAGSNFFGDRWTYFQVSGYCWALAGMTARGLKIEEERAELAAAEEEEEEAWHGHEEGTEAAVPA